MLSGASKDVRLPSEERHERRERVLRVGALQRWIGPTNPTTPDLVSIDLIERLCRTEVIQ
jgi:hypothetical protein